MSADAITAIKNLDNKNPVDRTETRLSPGDHTVALQDGREFIMHIPPNDGKTSLPVMFIFSGSGEGKWDIKDFVPESGMNDKADNPQNKFIAVYPLPARHYLGTGSDKTAYSWNVLDPKGGVLIDRADSLHAGYDDTAYVKAIAKKLPELANVDTSHKNWAAVGFSQGGVYLDYLASNVPHLFPTVAMVGSGLDTKYRYHVQPGNARNVAIFNLRADLSTLPFLDHTNNTYKEEKIARAILPKAIFEKLDDLAPINNTHADPAAQMAFYESRLKWHGAKVTSQKIQFATPAASAMKDQETIYKSSDCYHKQVAVFDFPTAQHSFPEADPSGKRTNATTKYTEFDTDQAIVDLWMDYNKRQVVSSSK